VRGEWGVIYENLPPECVVWGSDAASALELRFRVYAVNDMGRSGGPDDDD
jgi:hypothetical protein